MPGRVVAEKVRRPEARGLRRRRLVEPLLAPQAPRLALVVAPAGSGKTTLLAHVAADAGVPVGWYRAAPGDRSEIAFVRHVAAALGDVLDAELSSTVTDTEELLHRLDTWSGDEGLLVLDDLHEIAGTAAETALGRFLELRPPRLRILLAARRRPSVNLTRLQVADRLIHLDGDDLRFRSWEVERLFLDVYAEPLPPESAAALARRTEGWAAALQLFHLATAGKTRAQRRAAVGTLGGRSRLISSYLADNVLSELPAHRRYFLTRTCSLDLLSGPLCDELLDTTGSQSVLHELEQAQLFTMSEDEGVTFRYHQVLQDHLEVVLREELGQAGARAWFARSAQVLERAGHVREALRAHARAEDWASASQLLSRAGEAVAGDPHLRLDELLPPELCEQDPWLAMAEARRRLRHGDLRRAVLGFRRAEELFTDERSRAHCRNERVLASSWLPRPPARAARPFGHGPDPRHWSERLRDFTMNLRQQPRAAPGSRPGVTHRLQLGLASLLSGQFRNALAQLGEVIEESDADSVEHLAALTAAGVLEQFTNCGTERLEQAALAADVAGQPWLARLTRALLVPALRSGADEPERWCWSHVVRECESDGDEWGLAVLQLVRGAVSALTRGRVDRRQLEEAAGSFRRLRAPVLAVWADALRAVELAQAGRPEAEPAARQAESAARTLGVPGARSVACCALGRLGGDRRRKEWRRLAAHLADECGLPLPAVDALTAARAGPAPRRPAEVRLSLLGGFRLEVAGRVVDWTGVRPRVLVLLRLLALSAGVDVHRERLLEALWPGAETQAATRRLQVAVSSLRQALTKAGLAGGDAVRRHGDAYRLTLPPEARLDVRELDAVLAAESAARSQGQRARASAAAREALALYRGDLLPEDGPAEWVVGERQRLRLRTAVVARELAEDCVETGDLTEGVAAALRSLELEPSQERPWWTLARLHERAGDRAAAAHARREQALAAAELTAPAPPSHPGAGRRGQRLPRSTRPAPITRRGHR